MRCVAVGIGLMALASPGCAHQESISTLSPHEAKRQAQQMEDRIAALVPKEYVKSRDQRPIGTVMSCGDAGYSWNGYTFLALNENADFERTMRSVLAGLRKDSRYQVSMMKLDERGPLAYVRGPYGAEYLAGEGVEDLQYEISSSSPCFKLPGGIPSGGGF